MKQRMLFLILAVVMVLCYSAIVLPTGCVYASADHSFINIGPNMILHYAKLFILYFVLTYAVQRRRLIVRLLLVCLAYPNVTILIDAFVKQNTYLDIGFTTDPEPRLRFLIALLCYISTIALLEVNHYFYKKKA